MYRFGGILSDTVNVDREQHEPRHRYTAMDNSGQLASPPDDDTIELEMDVTEEVAERRRRFRAALALAGRNAREFARSLGVHESHLQQVLGRRRESVRVNEAIDQLIADSPGVSNG